MQYQRRSVIPEFMQSSVREYSRKALANWPDWEQRFAGPIAPATVAHDPKRCYAITRTEKDFGPGECAICRIPYRKTSPTSRVCEKPECKLAHRRLGERRRDAARKARHEEKPDKAACPHPRWSKNGDSKRGKPRMRCAICGATKTVDAVREMMMEEVNAVLPESLLVG
jgi:hypothetical protein